MGEHRRQDGRELLEWLVLLGRALGYWVDREWRVGSAAGDTRVDLVWHRRPSDHEPLFAFEVETTSLERLVSNAAKVLSTPTQERAKPLFLFHVLLGGGPRATLPQVAANTFPSANYAIYRLAIPGQADRLVEDILMQHARVDQFVNLFPLVDALSGCPAPIDIHPLLDQVQDCGLVAPYASDYAELTHRDRRFGRHFARSLLPELNGQRPPCNYESWMGHYWATSLHLGILASLDPEFAPRCADALSRWQSEDTALPAIAPAVGLSREYDDFVFAFAPYLWAVVAALMEDVPDAPDFVCRQMQRVLDGGPQAPLSTTGLTALWLLHISAAFQRTRHFEAARRFMNARGGVPVELQRCPPAIAGTSESLDEWADALAADPEPVPDLRTFQLVAVEEEMPYKVDPVDLAIELLLRDDAFEGGGNLVDWLHRDVASPIPC